MGDGRVVGAELSRRRFLTVMVGGAAAAAGLASVGAPPARAEGQADVGPPATVAGSIGVSSAGTTTRIDGERVTLATPRHLAAPASAVALTLPAGVERGWIRGGGIEGTTGWVALTRMDDGPDADADVVDDPGVPGVTELAWVRAVDHLEVALPVGADLRAVEVHLIDTLGLAAAARQGEHAVAAVLADLHGALDPALASAGAVGGLAASGGGRSAPDAAVSFVEAIPGVLDRTADRWQRYLGRKADEIGPDEAEPAPARPSRPAVVRRADWGAAAPRSSHRTARPRAVVLHHTVTRNDHTARESAAVVRAIQHHHQRTNGWSDVGYNLLVDRHGQVFEGRAGGMESGVVGAHARGVNTGTVGVAFLGNFEGGRPPQAGLDAVAQVLAWQARTHGIDLRDGATTEVSGRRIRTFSGHRDVGSTACPGRHLAARMPDIQRAARGR